MKKLLILLAVCMVLFACDKSTEPTYTVATPTFNPLPGTFFQTQTVHIRCSTSGAVIRYTLDGTEPTLSSDIYDDSSPVQVNSATIIKARAYKTKMNPSAIATGSYVFNVAAIFINPPGGAFASPQTITLSYLTQGTVIHYTIDGSEPTEGSPVYTEPFIVDGNTIIKAKGFIEGWNSSETKSATYVFNVTQPTLSHSDGTYSASFPVTISTPTAGATIRYTLDGGEPTELSNLFSEPVMINSSLQLKAKAFKTNWNASGIVTANYTLKVNPPVFSPGSATFNTTQKITITSSTPNAVIFFTTDGSEPTQDSDVYINPVEIGINTTIKARAFKTGWTPSNVITGVYYFAVYNPVFTPQQGTYTGPQTISITCATPGAEIRYTTNNSTPNINSNLYTEPFTIQATATVKAIAYKEGMNPSQITSGVYMITNQVATPTFAPDPGIYFEPVQVSLACASGTLEQGFQIRYTLDGSEPTEMSSQYYYPIQVSAQTEIKAKAFKLGWITSETAVGLYQFDTYDQIVAWGANNYNQTNVPIGTDFAMIDAGMYHTIALRTDGSLVAWGRNNNQQCNYPAGNNYVAVSAGDNHSLALRADGTIVAWGLNSDGQCDIPDSLVYTYVAISAGGSHSLALTSNNKIVAWGLNDNGQADAPADSNFVKISAGGKHNLALRDNGTLFAWGNNDNGQINAPTGNNFMDVAAGDQHSIAQRTTGVLVGWGLNSSGQTTVPSGTNYIKLSAGYRHNLALRSDGSVAHWGYSSGGLANVPTVSTFIDISAGRDFSVALKANTDTRRGNLLKRPKSRLKLK